MVWLGAAAAVTRCGVASRTVRIGWRHSSQRHVLFHHRPALSSMAAAASRYSNNNHYCYFSSSSSSSSSSTLTTSPSNKDNNTTTEQQERVLRERRRRPFEKVLIANRGEIVSRVIRTCRRLDIPTVAIYSTGDGVASPFVQAADESICIGPATAYLSYLNANNVLAAIVQSGATAVHPGYGFFSENAAFCQQVQDLQLSQPDAFNGKSHVSWLGPPPHAIRDMGDKLASKDIAVKAGVSIVPGHDKPVESLEEALALCSDAFPDNGLTYPVLLKAAAGGGGKGMRTCYNEQDLRDAWTVSKAESLNFFNDDRLLLEKYIEKPHHIEFQVLAYPAKNSTTTEVVVFPERECSIQRRNQKVLEESPSPLLTHETRQKMAEQVQRLCQATRYESAGTVEFLVDDATQDFYFLEMNTRLQVEHPVTEAVCGPHVDLVKAMLYIGAGWGLPPEMEALRDGNLIMPYRGHALEARIYAEDPLRGYLPSTGPLVPYVEPVQTFDVDAVQHGNHDDTTRSYTRIDSGVAPGHVVTPHYDPMIAKVVAYGRDRAACLCEMEQSLDEYVIGAGSGNGGSTIQHNVRLVRSVLREKEFQDGNTPTSFLPAHYPNGFHGVVLTQMEKHEFAAAAVAVLEQVRKNVGGQQHMAVALAGSNAVTDAGVVMVRLGGLLLGGPGYKVQFVEGGKKALVSAMPASVETTDSENKENEASLGEVTISLDGPVVYEPHRHLARISLNGTPRSIQVLYQDQATGETRLQMYGADYSVLVQSPREYKLSKHYQTAAKTWIAASNLGEMLYVRSPMPGRLVSFAQRVAPKVEVVEGQELCIVEAMKMQNIIRSPRTGVIKTIKVKEGAALATDQIIFEFEAPADAAIVSEEDEKKVAA
jgi:propionyl-CoA carboxylase alpha chain